VKDKTRTGARQIERRTVSRKTPGDGKLEITKVAAERLEPLGTEFFLAVNDTRGRGSLGAMPCTCRGGDKPHILLRRERSPSIARGGKSISPMMRQAATRRERLTTDSPSRAGSRCLPTQVHDDYRELLDATDRAHVRRRSRHNRSLALALRHPWRGAAAAARRRDLVSDGLCERTRHDAFALAIEHARARRNALVALRYDATEIMAGVSEVLCYGTAVQLCRQGIPTRHVEAASIPTLSVREGS
jgi:hypothetical protein